MRRLYVGSYDADHDLGSAIIIASSAKEAKKLAMSYFCDEGPEWIDIRIKWMKGVDINGLPDGINTDFVELMKREIISSCWGFPCPICGLGDCTIDILNGVVGCDDCLDKLGE